MDLIRSDGGRLLRKTVACVSAITLGTAMLLTSTVLGDLEARSDEVLFSDGHASTSSNTLTDKGLHYRC
jgi:hypothetical protein